MTVLEQDGFLIAKLLWYRDSLVWENCMLEN